MGEVVNVLVAFAVIVFLFKWATSSSESPEQRNVTGTLGFRPKNVTQDMVNTISTMFPDIPADNIRYDLLRTGSVEQTTNKILERGFLDAPPQAYHTLYPQNPTASGANPNPNPNAPNARTGTSGAAGPSASGSIPKKPTTTLISRYHLEHLAQLQSQSAATPAGASASAGAGVGAPSASTDKKVDSDSDSDKTNQTPNDDPFQAGGKAVWEDTPEKREESLRRRKAQMVLAARQRLLSQQQKEKQPAGTASTSATS